MFGFPFITSLVVVLLGVVALSLIVNKGLAHRKQASTPAIEQAQNSTPIISSETIRVGHNFNLIRLIQE